MNRALIPFGILFLVVGLGVGYLVYTHPEGLNPDWPLWMALLALSLFVAAGLHLIFEGLGYPRLSIVMLRVIVVGLLAIANWAAFLTTRVHCSETVSFLGIKLFTRYPSEAECRNSLRIIIACMDALILFLVVWWRLDASRRRDRG